MKKLLLTGAALVGLAMAAPAHALMPAKVLPGNVSFIAPPDAMPAEAWKPGDDVQVAQVGFGGMFPGPGVKAYGGGGGGYTGPGDVVAAQAAWSASWAYSSATRGNNLIQACNSGDANCVNIPSDATTGILAVSTTNVGANPCNDSTNICTIKTFYDLTGNGHTMTQTTAADRATLLVSCTGLGAGVPCATGTTARYQDGSNTTQAQPFTAIWVGNRNATASDDMVIGASDFSFKGGYGFFGGANRVACAAGNDETQSVTDGTWANVACVYNGSSSNIQINATNNTHNLGTTGISSGALRIFADGGSTYMEGKIAFIGWYTSAVSNGNISSISSAQHTIGGF